MSRMLTTSILISSMIALGGCSKFYKKDAMADASAPAPVIETASPEPWVAPAPEPITTEPPTVTVGTNDGATATIEQVSAKSYTIQRGDTLWGISKRFYGTGQKWKDITSANPGLSATRLRIGQTIQLP